MSFYSAYYGRPWPDNYIIGVRDCGDHTPCIREAANKVAARGGKVADVWLMNDGNMTAKLAEYDEQGAVDALADFRSTWSRPRPGLFLLRFPADGRLFDRVRREWLEEYRPVLAGEPAQRGPFDVYYNDNRLTYHREPCAPADAAAAFFLHLFPAGPASVLPERWRPYGFENRDFTFMDQAGALLENRCLVSVELPDYDIASIRTGQYVGDHRIWQANIPLGEMPPVADRYTEIASGAPDARSVFNLHLHRDGAELLYAKEPCAPADTAARFFLHLTPADPNVLPELRRSYGFDNRDFSFDPDGVRFDGKCLVRVSLPDYDIASIRTGQYTDAGRIWEVELSP